MKIDDLSIISPVKWSNKNGLWGSIVDFKHVIHIKWNFSAHDAMGRPEGIKFAVTEERLYIIPCEKDGFHVRSHYKRMVYSHVEKENLPENISLKTGDFSCKKDTECGLYYLDLSERKERGDIC